MGVRPPSRHHLTYQYNLWNQMFAAFINALWFRCFFGRFLHEGASSGTVRIHFRFNILTPIAADFISADYPYLREITECAADWYSVRSGDISYAKD